MTLVGPLLFTGHLARSRLVTLELKWVMGR